jgi:uncharacterized protein
VRSVKILASFLLLFVAGCAGEESAPDTASTSSSGEPPVVVINASGGERVEVEVEIADDAVEHAGMLFVFDREQPLSFWMRNTLIRSPSPT